MSLFSSSQSLVSSANASVETAWLLWLHSFSSPQLDQAMLWITPGGNALTQTVIALLLSVVFLRRPAWKQNLLTLWLAFGSSQIITQLLKLLFRRPRPQLWPTLIQPLDYSFPSGHALGKLTFYASVAFLLSREFPRCHRLIWSLTIPLILLIGLSRLWLGVHWPSDVLTGFTLGLFLLMLLIRWHQSQKRTD